MSNTLGLKHEAERRRNHITMRQSCKAADNPYITFSVKFLFPFLLFFCLQNSQSQKNKIKDNSDK